MIHIKRIYTKYDKNDGYRILIDRLWPRGLSKSNAHINLWIPDIAPSNELRLWFAHDPAKWTIFKKRYEKELKLNKELLQKLYFITKNKKMTTLLYAAKNEEKNNAIVLIDALEALDNK